MTIEAPRTARLGWQDCTIERIERLTPRIKSFFFRTPLAAPLAGQHVDVRLTAPDGYTAERSYSVASAPEDDLLELAIEELPGGEVSSFFHEVAEVGDTIEMRGPIGGHFVWRAEDGGPLLLIAGGSGIAPIVAMLRHRRNAGSDVPTLLLYSARSLADLAYGDEIMAMEQSGSGLASVFAITRGEAARKSDLARRFDRESLATSLSAWGRTPAVTYLCGANGFVEAISAGLLAAGLPARSIRVERFGGAPGE